MYVLWYFLKNGTVLTIFLALFSISSLDLSELAKAAKKKLQAVSILIYFGVCIHVLLLHARDILRYSLHIFFPCTTTATFSKVLFNTIQYNTNDNIYTAVIAI